MILPNTNLEGAGRVAENVRRVIEELRPKAGDDDITLTVSLGVAAVVPTAEMAPNDLVATADRALYQAKRRGRNRVELSEGGGDLLESDDREKPPGC